MVRQPRAGTGRRPPEYGRSAGSSRSAGAPSACPDGATHGTSRRAPVIQRQHAVGLGLLPPHGNHALQAFGVAVRQILAFRKIRFQVVQLPDIVVVGMPARVPRHRLPAIVHQRAVAEHLEILRAARDAAPGSAKVGSKLVPCTGICATPATSPGCAMPMASSTVGATSMAWQNWVRTPPAPRRPPGPMHDQRVAHAAAMGILLVPLERAVAGLCPAPGDVAVAVGAANVVEAQYRSVDVFAHAVEVPHLVQDAGGAAFLAGTVVRQQQEQGVVPGAKLLQVRHQATDLVVGVFQHGGKGLLQPRGKPLFVVVQRNPGL